MSANRTRVINRVQELLNLVVPGTYGGALSTRNKTRNAAAIADFVDEAGLMITKAIAEHPNEFRYQFYQTSTVTESGAILAPHLGPLARVLITPYDGGVAIDGVKRDYRKIQSYRNDTAKVYDAIAHDRPGSSLTGFYDLWEDRFYFTGFAATVTYARLPTRTDNATLIPEVMENTWVRLAMGEAMKIGSTGYESAVVQNYGQKGMADLQEFKTGSRQFAEIDDPQPQSAVHSLSK